MSRDPARTAALEVLTRVRERSAYAHETLDAVLKTARLEPRDAAFATRLAYGAVATRGTLDEAVARSVDPGTRLKPRIGDVLALGAYEVLFAGTPHHAAVDRAVELARSVEPRAAGLANAVMRRIARAAADFPWGDPATDIEALARLHGHPAWLARLWVAELGREPAAAVMAANNLPAPLFAADISPAPSGEALFDSLAADGCRPAPGPVPGSIVCEAPAFARTSAAIAETRALVMDAGAQFAVHVVRAAPGALIVEIGAGRGGKSLLLAASARRAGGAARGIVAVDTHAFKLEALAGSAQRAGFGEIRTLVADAAASGTDLGVSARSADAVLVDAPCSGLGTLRRHPDRRWRAQPEEIETLAALGSRLIERAAPLVRPGGFMVYSTCTIARRENSGVVESFLSSEAGSSFALDSLVDDVPDGWKGYVAGEGWFQSLPEPGGADGHFVARLVRVTDG